MTQRHKNGILNLFFKHNALLIVVAFILEKNKKLYINEINTIPNFFSHHLFEDKNIDYRELLGIMIKEAIDKIHKEAKMIHSNEDQLFKKVTSKDVRNMK